MKTSVYKLFLSSVISILFVSMSVAAQQQIQEKNHVNVQSIELGELVSQAVQSEIMRVYSNGIDDQKLKMKPQDIWNLARVDDQIEGCDIIVSGFAQKPNGYTTNTVKFFTCVVVHLNSSGQNEYSAEFIEDIQL